MLMGVREKKPGLEFIPFILVPCVMAVMGYFVMRNFVFDLVDEVWDAGNELIVKVRHREVRIPLAEIATIYFQGMQNPPRISIWTRELTEFGNPISFMPPFRLLSFLKPKFVDELTERCNVARSLAGH